VDTRDRIVTAACDVLGDARAGGITIALVAKRAGVSSALVHYHFSTKRRLLLAVAEAMAARRTEGRAAAVEESSGLSGLDALWAALVSGPSGVAERVWLDLVLVSRSDAAVRAALAAERERERARLARPLSRLLNTLGSRPVLPPEDVAATVGTFLDGVGSALAAGAPRDDVRASYDAFWLALVALGQTAPGR